MITVRRASGLAVPFEPPELTVEKAIDRNWQLREDSRLLEPKPDEYLLTYPVDRPWGYAPAQIPWHDDYDYGAFITGLPKL